MHVLIVLKLLYIVTHYRLYTDFDYDSILMYDPYSFSKNGEPTLIPKDPDIELVSAYNETRLSCKDIVALNEMYNC